MMNEWCSSTQDEEVKIELHEVKDHVFFIAVFIIQQLSVMAKCISNQCMPNYIDFF